MKKLISIILITVMLVCIIPASAETLKRGNFEYAVNEDGTASICAYTGGDSEVVIPDEIDGKTVTEIGFDAFMGNQSIVSVDIPDTVNSIGAEAFSGCSSLSEITIPDGVTNIIRSVFEDCTGLKKVSLPKSIKEISSATFTGCNALESITVDSESEYYYVEGNCLISKKENAVVFGFGNCVIPNDGSIKRIKPEAFGKVSNICEEIEVPEGVEVIEGDAFNYATALKSITLPSSLKTIRGYLLPSADVTVYYNGTAREFSKIAIDRVNTDPDIPFSTRDVDENLFSAKIIFKTKIDVVKEFGDVTSKKWYVDSVDYVVNNGIMFGSTDTEFSPDRKMTRAMFATVLWRADGESMSTENSPFTDLKADWYREAVKWAYNKKIVNGTSETKFSPNGSITREQLATMLYRYAGYKKLDTSKQAELTKFADAKKVSSYAETAVKWAVAEGIIGGIDKNGKAYLDPQGNATRAQVATMLMRFCDD